MEKTTCFYRQYIQGVVAQANKAGAQYDSNLVYRTLVKWSRTQNIRLENEMFRAVLSASHNLAHSYSSSGTANIKEACEQCRYFHTFTASDGIHTDIKQVKKYVKDFWPVLKENLDDTKDLGNVCVRTKCLDVVSIGRLFDSILQHVPEEKKGAVVSLMDEFVRADLQK